MKKTLLYSVLSLSLIFPTISNAQCGFDVIRNKQLQNPAFEMQEQANELKIKNFVNNVSLTGKAGTVYTIPVVVHVLHKGEAVGSGTNISDAQIQSGIDRLNEVYRGLDPNSPIDFEIEFTLAQRDPNCNATTGINRINATSVPNYSASGVFLQSVGADENTLKDLSRWPETDYLNIWIVTEIDNNNGGSGIQGYANFFNGNAYEGSVMMYTVFGYDPTNANPSWPLSFSRDNSTPIHEFGHYFHLYHTFQGDNDDVDCPGDAVVGTDSDGCADTEIHKRHTSTCPTNNDCLGNNPYGLNTRNNYMSYFSCTDRLTNNQKTRVTAAMSGTSIVASKGGIAPDPSYAAPVAVCNTNTVTTSNAGITSVELNGTTFTSFSSSSDGGNIDKSANCSGYFEIDASVSNTINVGMYTVNFQQLGVWIDWNDDGDFNDDSEQQHLSEDIAAGSTVPIIINYPTSIPYDDYVRIRLITDLDNRYGPGTINSSCYGSIVYGQSEDYAIYVQPAAGVAPVADFSGTPTTLCAGNTVVFTDLSTNTPTSWSWTFTGGTPSSSTLQNPTITYNTAGTYQVQLTATNASGSDVETKVAYITVNPAPSISSHPSNSSINDGDNTSFSVVALNATGYQWQVNTGGGFGNISNGGVYSGATTSTLAITGAILTMDRNTYRCVVSGSCAPTATSNSALLSVAEIGSAPVADFSANTTTICAGESVNFTDLSTNTPISWSWDFGDGGSSTSQNTTYTYNTAGTYTVTLTATNASGSDDEVKTNLITVNELEDASFNYSSSTYCQDGVDPTPTILGTTGGIFTRSPVGLVINSTTGIIDLSASTAGTYTVTYTTSGFCSDVQNVQVTIVNCGSTELKPIYRKTYVSYSEKLACYIVSGAQQYEWEFTPSGGGIPLTYNWGINNPSILLGWIPGIQDGTTYDVRIRAKVSGVFGSFGNTWSITTPDAASQTQLVSTYCGKIYTSYAELLNAYAVSSATEYEFEFTPVGGGTVVNYIHTGNSILLSWAVGLIDNTSYNVRVRAKVSGVFGTYGASCQITTPSSSVITSLKSIYCGVTYTSMSNKLACYAVTDAEDYEFEFIPVGGGTPLLDTNISTSPSILLNMMPGIQVSTTYDVRVRAKLSGVYGSFGSSCQVTTPSSAMISNETARLIFDNETEEDLNTPSTTLNIYPNPNTGEQLSVNLENLTPNSTLTITDIYGKIILTKPLNTDQSEYKVNVKFENKLASGFYFINIVSDGNRITEKLLVR
ncbi:MAG: PKD domain-containing protein [Bacteroidetes bacterium]|nr:PKD domain-containing protein [Bacteroidota bacterium]